MYLNIYLTIESSIYPPTNQHFIHPFIHSSFQIDIYMLAHPDDTRKENEATILSKDTNRCWRYIDTLSTDKHGRVSYNLSMEEFPLSAGIYPIIFLVK